MYNCLYFCLVVGPVLFVRLSIFLLIVGPVFVCMIVCILPGCGSCFILGMYLVGTRSSMSSFFLSQDSSTIRQSVPAFLNRVHFTFASLFRVWHAAACASSLVSMETTELYANVCQLRSTVIYDDEKLNVLFKMMGEIIFRRVHDLTRWLVEFLLTKYWPIFSRA